MTGELRWTLTYDFTNSIVYPVGEPKFLRSREEGEGRMRLALKDELVFGSMNERSRASYHELLAIEEGPSPCSKLTLTAEERMTDGTYRFYWRGRFSVRDMVFDKIDCQVRVKPKEATVRECLLDGKTKKFNVMSLPRMTSAWSAPPSPYEFLTCRPSTATVSSGGCDGLGPDLGWAKFYEQVDADDDVTIWWREVRVVLCDGDAPGEPPGGGWNLIEDNCADNGTCRYGRIPSDPAPDPSDVYVGSCAPTEGGCLAVPPPTDVDTFTIEVGSSPDQVIIGQKWRTWSSQTMYFKAQYIRPGSTYVWTVLTSGWTITAGQGTAELTVNTPYVLGSNLQVQLQETTACGVVTVTFTSYFLYTDLTVGNDPDMALYGPSQYYAGEVLEFYVPVQWTGVGFEWLIVGSYTDLAYLDGGSRVRVTPTGSTLDVSYRVKMTPGAFVGSNYVTINAALASYPMGVVLRPQGVLCAAQLHTLSVANPHLGAEYIWTVDGGSIVLGQGTSRIFFYCSSLPGTYDVTVGLRVPINPGWIMVSPCGPACEPSYFWVQPPSIEYRHFRSFYDVCLAVAQTACPDVTSIVSDFFQWNPLTPSSVNYATGLENKLRHVAIATTGDVIFPDATEPARKNELDFGRLIQLWQQLWQLEWWVEGTVLRVEHVSYPDVGEELDLTVDPHVGFLPTGARYRYTTEKMPAFESWQMTAGVQVDFLNAKLLYEAGDHQPDPCVGEGEAQHNPGDIVTDIGGIQTYPDDFSRSGFVLVALAPSVDHPGDWDVLSEEGKLSGTIVSNGHLSWANLVFAYWRHNRIRPMAWMNNVYQPMLTTIRTKVQDSFDVIMTPEARPTGTKPGVVKTHMGLGRIDETTEDPTNCIVSFKLSYPQ